MNVFTYFRHEILAILERLATAGAIPAGLNYRSVGVEPPKDPTHGELATNAAMVLAKTAGMKPRDLAELLIKPLTENAEIVSADIAGPGFINIRLRAGYWQERVVDVLNAGKGYGRSRLGQGRRVNVEYVSANPTGPMHVGHCRGAVFGDALCNLLVAAGFDVEREYYINDAGVQVDVLARSVHLRYREALGEDIGAIPEGLYPGDYLRPIGATLAAEHGPRWVGKGENEWLDTFRRFAIDAMMALIKEDLRLLGISHSVFSSERSIHESGKIQHALDVLASQSLLYTGTLDPPKGKLPDDWEPRPQLLFKSSQFGDDVDRPLKKSDGTWTYFAADIAYHLSKVERGFSDLIDVWGADHGGYIRRMRAAIEALSGGSAQLDVKICQLVNLLNNGQPVRMSKRAGSFVTLREVVEEVGKDVVRFMMLIRKNDAPIDFDFAKVTEQSKDNPVFYVQYAHARACSVLRNMGEPLSDTALASVDMSLLQHDAELQLIRHIASWPRQLEAAAEAHEPHRVAFYLYDLAAAFHALWNLGKESEDLRFILPENRPLSLARMALVRATALTIAAGLAIMGVDPVEEMR